MSVLAVENGVEAADVKTITPLHTFTLKFTNKVDASELKPYIELACANKQSFTVKNATSKSIQIIPNKPLTVGETCTVCVSGEAKSKSGKTLGKDSSQSFTVKEAVRTAKHDNAKLVNNFIYKHYNTN